MSPNVSRRRGNDELIMPLPNDELSQKLMKVPSDPDLLVSGSQTS